MISYLLKHRDELINKLLEKLNVNKFLKIQDNSNHLHRKKDGIISLEEPTSKLFC